MRQMTLGLCILYLTNILYSLICAARAWVFKHVSVRVSTCARVSAFNSLTTCVFAIMQIVFLDWVAVEQCDNTSYSELADKSVRHFHG